MKKLARALGAALLVALVGCQFPANDTGSLRVKLPSPRAVAVNNGKGDLVRIQLIRNGVVVPLEGKAFRQESLAGQTITMNEMTVGSGYTLNVATGQALSSGFFEVAYFQTTDRFEISAGVDTTVNVTLGAAPFALEEATASADHAVAVLNGTSLAYIDGTSVKMQGTVQQTIPLDGLYSAGAKVKGLSFVERPFLNDTNKDVLIATTKGLAYSIGFGAPVLKMSHDVENVTDPVVFSPEVWFSGSFTAMGTDNVKNTVYAYGGPGLNAGVAVTKSKSTEAPANPGVMRWYDLEGLLGLDGMEQVKESLKGGEPAITGFTATQKWSWMASALGTFRIEGSMITDGTKALGDAFQKLDPAVMIKAVFEGRTEPIVTVAGVSGRGYAGTQRGLFTGVLSEDGTKAGSVVGAGALGDAWLGLIAGTRNLSIAQVAAYKKEDGTVYAAAFTPTTRELLIVTNDAVTKRFPVFSGLPKGDLKFAWWLHGTILKLAISGDDATVTYTVP